MKKIYRIFLFVPLIIACLFGIYSLVDADDAISEKENRGLAQKPEFTFADFMSGKYMEELEEYYKDQFPLREQLISANTLLNNFYTYTGSGEGTAVSIQMTRNDGAGGIGTTGGTTTGGNTSEGGSTATSSGNSGEGSSSTGGEATSETGGETGTSSAPTLPTEETDPEFDNPENAQTVSDMLYVNGRAMEVVYYNESTGKKYATAVNNIAEAMPNLTVYNLLTPNSTQWYGPESVRSGSTDQKNMIDSIYAQENSSVIKVDAYSKLRRHIDEYIYFRTDHHWTALGAYYAYTAYCESAGLTAVPLSQFETGTVTNSSNGSTRFLGTLYSYLDAYPTVRAEMESNPDYVTYYYPVVKCDATAYTGFSNGKLSGANNGITTVAKTLGTSYLYMAFICGDQPIEIIETEADSDRVVIVLKESYGNAFVPFLTSHYKRVVVVDPREFNHSGAPSLYLPDLAEYVGATDLIVINYPYMPMNQYFINRLNGLVGIAPE